MERKNALVGAVAVLAAAAVLLVYAEMQKQSRISELEKGIGSRYNGTVSGIVYEKDCMICTEGGCKPLGKECWKANVTTQETFLQVALDSGGNVIDYLEFSSGESGGSEEGGGNSCSYQYTESLGNVSVRYTNTGCSNPKPSCAGNVCSECRSQTDCIALAETFYMGQPVHTVLGIISTPYNGYYNYTTGRCIIDDSVITIYDNVIGFEECYNVVASYLECVGGMCDFI
jgi:hypothetical protein